MMANAARYGSVLLAVLIGTAAMGAESNVDLPRYPAISPDGSSVTFTWRGDIWKVDAEGGTAVRLTRHPGDDLRSAWSPDGTEIAFNSNRNGYTNIYLMTAEGTDIRHVTDIDRTCTLRGFGVDEDGETIITFDARLEEDMYRSLRPYQIAPEGGEMARLHDAYGSHPIVSPNGRYIAFTRGGWYYGWSRRHNRGPEAQEVWLYDREDETFRQLTHWTGNEGKARWVDDEHIVFMSDREDDCVNLYRLNIHDEDDSNVERLTDFGERDVHQFDIAADGETLVFMQWDTLYTLDLSDDGADPVALAIRAAEDDDDNYEVRSVAREVNEAALSPDEQVMATAAYGRVYVRNVDSRSPTRRITDGHSRNRQIAWSPDGVTLYFTSDRDGTESIYAATVTLTRSEVIESYEAALNGEAEDEAPADEEGNEDEQDEGDEKEEEAQEEDEEKKDLPDPDRWHDAMKFAIEPVVQTEHNDMRPQPSPCGRYLSFQRNYGDLVLLDLASGEERVMLDHWDRGMDWRFSPDGHYIAYSVNDLDFSANIFVVPTDGSEDPVNISKHPRNDINPRWSADGKIISFRSNRQRSGQRSPNYDIYAVYLDRDLEGLSRKELDEYYEEASDRVKKREPLPVDPDERELGERPELDLDDAYLRIRRIFNNEESVSNNEMTPDGGRIIFNARIDGSWGMYSVRWHGGSRRRLGGNVNMQHMTLDGSHAVFVRGSRAGRVSPTGGSYNYTDISDSIRIDLQEQAEQKFRNAARTLGDLFYHHEMKGLDWSALTEEYLELARQSRTGEEFSYVGDRFLGELAGSHLGIRESGYSARNRQSMGRLGIDRERVELDHGHGYRVTHVIPNGPAELGTMKLEVGDVITAVDLEPFGPRDTLETALRGLVGEETIITVQREREDGETVELNTLLTPISFGRQYSLQYEAWRQRNADLIDEWSDGRVGYIHIRGMNQSSLDDFKRDLYAAIEGKDGLLIDVRNNGGGWTADRILAAIMPRHHAYTIPRGADLDQTGHYPQDRLLMPRFTGEVNMLCNEKSFSNAEIVSHAFKTLGRGTLVGQQTWGGVISTSSFGLIDGTSVRLPYRGWYLPDGTDMENNGAIPDLIVPQRPEAEVRDEDEQLRAAFDDVMERLD